MDLNRKLGPLPVWAWALIGVGVGYYFVKKKQAATAASQATLSPVVEAGPATINAGTGGVATPSQSDWQTQAANGAIAAGYNPSQVENALSSFSTGQPLDQTQEGILNWILQNYGSPPSGVSPVVAGALPPPQVSGSASGASSEAAANPFGVGTVVSSYRGQAEKIASEAGGTSSFGPVGVTNFGGLYTVPGVNVSGSEYNPSATPGEYSATLNGNEVVETGPTGTKIFTLSGAPK